MLRSDELCCCTDSTFNPAGDKRGGSTRVLYDPSMSDKGVLSAAGRAPRVANPFDVGLPMVIKTPHALPMYREERVGGKKRQREKMRQVMIHVVFMHAYLLSVVLSWWLS